MTTAGTPSGLTVRTRGSGPDVVLLHGALGDLRQWEPIVGRLSRRFRASAVSRRFHWPGSMPPGGASYTFQTQTADAVALLESFDGPVHLVGHSYGAGVSLLAALDRPELIRTLTLIEPPFASLVTASTGEFAREADSRHALVAAIQSHVKAGLVEQASEVFIDWVQGAPGGLCQLPSDVQEGLFQNAPTIGPMYATPQPAVTCEQLRALRRPALVLRGERTRPWFRLIAQAAAACLPGAETAQVPAAAHMCIVENPDATATLIERFIAER